jgi:sulfide:quinone oxidoreductase
VRLSSGERLPYDDLVLAVGARAVASIPGALTFRDQRDLSLFSGVLRDLVDGEVQRLVFALPEGPTWPVPLYELALLSAGLVAEHGLDTKVTIVSPEPAPLSAFGAKPSELVSELLASRQIAFVGEATGCEVHRHVLALRSGELIEADRVVAVPQLRGQPIAGVPHKPSGFVPVDGDGRVTGLRHVYAAGDMTSFPVKQAGLATQQADRIANVILTSGGAGVPPVRTPRVLQARLIGGDQPLFLRAELDEHGRATSATLAHETSETPIHTKVFARYLTPYLAERAQAVVLPTYS